MVVGSTRGASSSEEGAVAGLEHPQLVSSIDKSPYLRARRSSVPGLSLEATRYEKQQKEGACKSKKNCTLTPIRSHMPHPIRSHMPRRLFPFSWWKGAVLRVGGKGGVFPLLVGNLSVFAVASRR